MPETRALSVAMQQCSEVVKKRNKLQFPFSVVPTSTLRQHDVMGREGCLFVHSFIHLANNFTKCPPDLQGTHHF